MIAAEHPHHNPIPIREFNVTKQAGFFENLKQSRFSGQLVIIGPKQTRWIFFLYLGRIIYATGGLHPVRRWRRNIALYFPEIASQISTMQLDMASIAIGELRICWEYKLLCSWVEQKKIALEQAAQMIRASVVEILFDINQVMEVSCELRPENLLPMRLVLIDADKAITDADQQWQAWLDAKIADRSPDKTPSIRQPEQLKQRTSEQVYQTLTQLLDGRSSLRDLSVKMKRDVLTLTSSLLPYLQMGLLELVEVPDLPAPYNTTTGEVSTAQTEVSEPTVSNFTSAASDKQPLIACVDDSQLMCQTMEKILTSASYEFVSVNDALRAIAVLLARKPDLIFLDLVMPNANGYEICSQLRKLSFFRHTPIIILTGNDGIIDRVRAKMVGSSDFISKPVNQEGVLSLIRKHLKEVSVA